MQLGAARPRSSTAQRAVGSSAFASGQRSEIAAMNGTTGTTGTPLHAHAIQTEEESLRCQSLRPKTTPRNRTIRRSRIVRRSREMATSPTVRCRERGMCARTTASRLRSA